MRSSVLKSYSELKLTIGFLFLWLDWLSLSYHCAIASLRFPICGRAGAYVRVSILHARARMRRKRSTPANGAQWQPASSISEPGVKGVHRRDPWGIFWGIRIAFVSSEPLFIRQCLQRMVRYIGTDIDSIAILVMALGINTLEPHRQPR